MLHFTTMVNESVMILNSNYLLGIVWGLSFFMLFWCLLQIDKYALHIIKSIINNVRTFAPICC